jgi:hypothetical protein
MVSTYTATWHDGRPPQEIECPPYPITAKLDVRKIDQLMADGVWSDEDLDRYGLKTVIPFAVPAGKQATGGARYVEEGGQVIELFDVIDVEQPRRKISKSVIIDRLTDEQLAAAITGMTIRQQERWRAPDLPEVYADDPEILAVLHAIGADPEVVLAP